MKIPVFSFFCLVFLQVLAFPGLGSESKVQSSPAPIGYPLTPVGLGRVALGDGFWGDRMKTHVKVTIPHVLKTLGVDYSDPRPGRSALALVRTLEGVSYSLLYEDHKELRAMMKKMCANVGELSKEGNRWFGAVPEAPAFFSIVTGKGWQTEIIFENHSGNLVKLCWINYRGGLQSHGQIKPGEERVQATNANATWAVTDESDKWLGYFIASHEITSGTIPKK